MDAGRRKRRIAKRRGEILAVAKRLFLARPYTQVSVDEIAAAADLSKATIYGYFKTKIEIYSAMVLADAELLIASLEAATDRRRPIGANLRAMAAAYMAFFLAHPEYFEKLSWFYFPGREKHLSTAVIQEVGKRFDAARAVVEKTLRQAMRKGEIRRIDPQVAAVVIYSQWLGLSYLAVASGPARGKLHIDLPKASEFASTAVLQGLLISDNQGPRSGRFRA